MHTRSDNIEITIGDDNDDIIEELFKSFIQKYEENLQNKMRGSDFEFDGVNFLYYDFNEISLNRGGSYIDSQKWLKDKKSTIDPKNNDDKCFQYAVTLALNLDNIDNHSERISKIKPFISQYNWKDPYEYMDNWERFNETSLPSKESFYSNLNIENIDDIDYRHGNNVFKIFKLKNLGEYHDLYVHSDTLLLADVFENFRNNCVEVYELDPAHFCHYQD